MGKEKSSGTNKPFKSYVKNDENVVIFKKYDSQSEVALKIIDLLVALE